MATVALVSCVKQKRSSPCAGQDMYTSPLFRKARAYAESVADAWFILSAKYGLLRPATCIEPYEQTLKEASASQRRAWAAHVHEQMRASGLLVSGTRFIWLAGMDYQQDLARRLRELGDDADPFNTFPELLILPLDMDTSELVMGVLGHLLGVHDSAATNLSVI